MGIERRGGWKKNKMIWQATEQGHTNIQACDDESDDAFAHHAVYDGSARNPIDATPSDCSAVKVDGARAGSKFCISSFSIPPDPSGLVRCAPPASLRYRPLRFRLSD